MISSKLVRQQDIKNVRETAEVLAMILLFLPSRIFSLSMRFLTKYYPFSLFFRNRMFHYRNRHLQKLMTTVETVSKSEGRPFAVDSIYVDQYFCSLTGRFKNTGKNIALEKIMSKIAAKLEVSAKDVYIRDNSDKSKKIVIPVNAFMAPEKYFGI